jgi:hypothetical protein
MNEISPENIKIIVKTNPKDWFDDLSSEEKQEIEMGLKEVDNDQLMSNKEAMSQFAKWH